MTTKNGAGIDESELVHSDICTYKAFFNLEFMRVNAKRHLVRVPSATWKVRGKVFVPLVLLSYLTSNISHVLSYLSPHNEGG